MGKVLTMKVLMRNVLIFKKTNIRTYRGPDALLQVYGLY